MLREGKGNTPVPYAVLVLGSAGRGESLHADQDNAFVYAEGEPDGPEDRWFAEAGAHMADVLHEVGIPYCDGGVMARIPAAVAVSSIGSRRSAAGLSNWNLPGIRYRHLFDGVPVHGEMMLAEEDHELRPQPRCRRAALRREIGRPGQAVVSSDQLLRATASLNRMVGSISRRMACWR